MGRKGAALLLGTEADAPASFPPPFLMLLPFSDPRLDFFHAPLLCLAEPNGSSSACRERSPEPAWSTQAAAERQTRLDEKRCQDHGIQPSSLAVPRKQGKSQHRILLGPAAGWKCLQPGAASPLLHLQLLLRAGQSPSVLSEQRFHSWQFEQRQLLC